MQQDLNEFVNLDDRIVDVGAISIQRWSEDDIETADKLPIYVVYKGARCEVEKEFSARVKSGGKEKQKEIDQLLTFAEHIVEHDISHFGAKYERYTPRHGHAAIPDGMDAFKIILSKPDFRVLVLRGAINGRDSLIICAAGRNHATGNKKHSRSGPLDVYNRFGESMQAMIDNGLVESLPPGAIKRR